MNKGEIINMPAGQEMDLLISEKVLGLSVDEWNKRFFRNQSHYSTDMSAAWVVVEKMAKVPFAWHFESINVGGGVMWWCLYWGDDEQNKGEILEYFAEAQTAPLAICRAALLFVSGLNNACPECGSTVLGLPNIACTGLAPLRAQVGVYANELCYWRNVVR